MPCLVITWAQLLTFSKSVKVLRHIFGVFLSLWRRDALSAISKFAFPVFSCVLLASRSLCSLNSPLFYFILNNIAVRLGGSPIVCVILISLFSLPDVCFFQLMAATFYSFATSSWIYFSLEFSLHLAAWFSVGPLGHQFLWSWVNLDYMLMAITCIYA